MHTQICTIHFINIVLVQYTYNVNFIILNNKNKKGEKKKKKKAVNL